MPFGRRSPLEALALPGVILAYKYSQFRQRRREAASRRVTERELSALHHKIDKLLNKLEESEPEPPTSQEDECVICINARATMQTSPCGHRVVCRRCFVKTIQSAVAQRLLPLRCVICRARINRLTSGSGTWRLQESASSYSMGTTKSWSVLGSSSSSYSVGARVAQSTSLYSMSSGSSCVSGDSSVSNCSNSSGSSDGMSSTSSKCSSINDNGHRHIGGICAGGGNCHGAYPRNPQYSYKRSKSGRVSELQNRLPPIKEFRSPTKVPMPSPSHNPKIRFASYTQNSKTNENCPLLGDENGSNAAVNVPRSLSPSASILKHTSSKLGSSKIAPMHSLKSPINMAANSSGNNGNKKFLDTNYDIKANKMMGNGCAGSNAGGAGAMGMPKTLAGGASAANASSTTHRGLILLSKSTADERADNRKNENAEKKKRDEKLKLKTEKDARKEEKRLAKEEERLAKLLAKEEKKKGKREAKELLLAEGRKK